MIVYSVQSKEILDKLLKDGFAYTDDKYSKYKPTGDINKYHIIAKELEEKVKKPNYIKLPMWAAYKWYGYTGDNLKQFLKYNTNDEAGRDYLFVLEIPDREIMVFSELDINNYTIKFYPFGYDFNEDKTDYDIQVVFWQIKREYVLEIIPLKNH